MKRREHTVYLVAQGCPSVHRSDWSSAASVTLRTNNKCTSVSVRNMKTCGPDGRPDDVTKKGKNWQSPEYCVNFTNQSEWRRPVGRPYTSWMATLKNDLAQHNLTLEEAIKLALNKPLWRLLAASGATHWWCMPNNDDGDDQRNSTSPVI